MNLKNKIIPNLNGKSYHILTSRPTSNPGVSVYLFSGSFTEPDYSLWNVEIKNEGSFALWPYEGDDYDDLVMELGQAYLYNAFNNDK